MVVGWFTRIIVVFAVIGALGFDGIALLSAHLGAQQDANDAASDAAAAWQTSHSTPGALAAAQSAAEARLGERETLVPGTFRIGADGTVSLRVHRVTGRTLLAHDLGFLKPELSFDATGSAPPPAP